MLFYLLHFYFILKDKTRLLNLGKLIDWKFGLLFLVGKATQEDSEDGQWLTESLTSLWKKTCSGVQVYFILEAIPTWKDIKIYQTI